MGLLLSIGLGLAQEYLWDLPTELQFGTFEHTELRQHKLVKLAGSQLLSGDPISIPDFALIGCFKVHENNQLISEQLSTIIQCNMKIPSSEQTPH